MKHHIILALVLAATGCVTANDSPVPVTSYTPTEQSAKSTTELLHDLETQLKNAGRFVRLRPYKGNAMVSHDHLTSLRVGSEGVAIEFANALVVGTGSADIFTYEFVYKDLAALRFDTQSCHPKAAPLPDGMEVRFAQPVARTLCDTLFTLGQRFAEQKEKDQALFDQQAARYRSLAVKPALSEEQRRLIIQAEAQRERKAYVRAIELFRKAVALDAVAYPPAYFNLALLYEQQALYGRAVESMRRYLQLVPNAADARPAQDKIYEWEALAEDR